LAARIVHPGQLRSETPWLSDLVELEVYDCVGQNEGLRILMEENYFPENPPGNGGLINLGAPLLWLDPHISVEVHVDASRVRPLAHARRCPGDRLPKCPRPFTNVRVMELVRRHEMADLAHRLETVSEPRVECNGRMEEKVSVAQPHHGHPSRKR